MGCMWETTGDMGRPLGCSPFPRYLAQHLALVPRAHKAHSGRKVSNSGPAHPSQKQFFLPSSHVLRSAVMATCPMTPKLAHATIPFPQLRAEDRRAFPPRETRLLQQRGNLLIPQRRIREFMLGPFANALMFIHLSVHTTHFNFSVVGR